MKKQLLLVLFTASCFMMFAQDLPTNPEPGKCYVRCTTPDVWKNETVTIETKATYKKLVTHPAQYKTVTERVLIKEASYSLKTVPAEYGTETISYTSKVDASSLKAISATFRNDSQTVEIKPASAEWQMSDKAPDCQSSNPDDCRYWCYVQIPAQYTTVSQVKLASNARIEKAGVPGATKTYKKRVMTKEPYTARVEIPAEFAEIKKVVLVKDAWSEEVTVPAEYKTVTKEVLATKGGLTTWKEVDCSILEYSDLLIDWDLDSATLTARAKSEIDAKLLPVLKQGLRVEVASHTDSRGNDEYNRDLSERRAQAVTNYLISKGTNPSLIVSNGYGESRLINRCSNGVSCTEREHRKNRRTQFRVINQ